MPEESPLYCPLDSLAYIEVSGDDAESFLQSQLGRDIGSLDERSAPLAAWHDARGRVRALVRILRLSGGYLLLLPADIARQTAAKLGMFVLRADVKITQTTRWSGLALLGAPPVTIGTRSGESLVRTAHAICVGLSPSLTQVIATSDTELDVLRKDRELGSAAALELAEIELGLPSVGAAASERYLPQMLNLDVLGAVSFDKGCYPGQEVIARTQNLGTVKRRLARFGVTTGAAIPVGAEIVSGDATVVGHVLRSAAVGKRSELLGVARIDALDGQALRADAQPLERLALPYELP